MKRFPLRTRIPVRRLHQLQAVGRVQLLVGRVQDGFRLFRRRRLADDRPALGIQPGCRFPVLLAADNVSVVAESADELVALEALLVQDLQQLCRFFIQVLHIFRLILTELFHDVQCIIQLEGNKCALAL